MGQRGRPPKRGTGKKAGTHITHANGSAEISFQANVNQPALAIQTEDLTSSNTAATRGRWRVDPQPQPAAPLPTVSEESEQPNCHPESNSIAGAVSDSPSNPFVAPPPTSTTDSTGPSSEDVLQVLERLQEAAGFTEPSSPEAESFAEPSPTSTSPPNSPTRGTQPPRHGASGSRHSPRAGPHSSTSRSRTASVASTQAHAAPRRKKDTAKDVWAFYKKLKEARLCLFCELKHSVDPSHEVHQFGPETGTSTLRAHLYTRHLEQWVDSCDKFKFPITAAKAKEAADKYRSINDNVGPAGTPKNGRPSDIPEFSHEAFLDAITEFIVTDDQSLNVIESPHLRRIFMLLRQDLKDSQIPHRSQIRDHIKKIWDDYLISLEKELKDAPGKISFTTDLWSDPNLSPFMAVTAHWIEAKLKATPDGPQYDLKLRVELIGFHRVPGTHTGEHLAHAFLHILDRLSITSKIGWVTMDNASNNNTLMSTLENELLARGIPFDRISNRIRCFPHIVNLACQAVITALSSTNYVQDSDEYSILDSESISYISGNPISALRSLIRAVRASSLRRQHFADVSKSCGCADLQLLRDVDTRWSSVLYMIERALLMEKPLDLMSRSREFGELDKHRLSNAEWDALATVREILLIPDAFQQKLSAEKTPTLCNAIPSFDAMVKIWKDCKYEYGAPFEDVIQEGIDKINVYQGHISLVPAYIFSMFLNPFMKLREVSSEKIDEAKVLIRRILLPYYGKRTNGGQLAPSHQSTPQTQPSAPLQRPLRASDYTPHRSRAIRGRSIRSSVAHRTADEILGLRKTNVPESSLDDEIARYLNDSSTTTSSLMFWQEHQLRYPTIFLASLDYLAIQGSAVPCERVFSSAKETMTDRRNRINEDLMEMLQMLKFSFKGGRSLDFSQGTSREDIIEYLEHSLMSEIASTEDVATYVQSLLSTMQ